MPLSPAEGVAAAFRELPIYSLVNDLVAKMPPAESRKAIDYAPFVGAKEGTVVYRILAAVNAPVHKFADLITILELDPASPLGQQLIAIDLLIVDAKS